MAKKETKKYYLPANFPTPHIQLSGMPYLTEHNGVTQFWGGGNTAGTNDEETGTDQYQQMQQKQSGGKGSQFMQGMNGVADGGGVGTIIGSSINDQTMDKRGYQDPMDGRAAGYWQGTSKGAMMGKSFGPWGMLIGATVGGIYGGISGNANAKKRNKLLKDQQTEENQGLAQNQVANPYARANGGPLNLPEMEGYNTYKGNSHESGGIPIGQKAEVEGGEVNFNNYIYSDRLTPNGKKATFADMAKRIRAKYKGREEDKAAKVSMERDLTELAKQNDEARTLKEQQDSIAQQTQELQDIHMYGGCIKYENGGLVLDEDAHNKLRRVAKKRGVEFPDLLTNIYSNTQKFALGGYNDFASQYGQNTDQLNLINQYPDGGPLNKKMSAQEWDTYNTSRGWTVDPRNSGNATGYKAYYDPKALKINPSTNHESGYEVQGLNPDAVSYGMVSPKYHQNYEYKAPVPKTGTGTPTVLPTSNRTAIGFDTIGTTYKDNNTGETYTLDLKGNKIEPLTKANGGPIEFGGGGYKDDPNLSMYSKEDLQGLGYNTNNNQDNSNGFKFGNEEGALVASSLPAIYNLIKGSKAAVTKFDRVKPDLVNLNSQRKGITQEGDRAKRTALEIARSVGGGSGSVLAALSAMNSNINQNVMDKLSDSYSSEANTNVGIKNQAAYTNTNISMQEKIANEQNKAMADSLIGHGLSNLGTNAQLYTRDKKLASTNDKQNDTYMQVINQMFPEYKWGQDPNSDKLMIQYVSTLKPTE